MIDISLFGLHKSNKNIFTTVPTVQGQNLNIGAPQTRLLSARAILYLRSYKLVSIVRMRF